MINIDAEAGIQLLDTQWEEMMCSLDNYANEELRKLNFRKIAKDLAEYKKFYFFERFLEYYDYDKSTMEIDIRQVKKICRVVEERNKDGVSADRFIPKWEYASVNRMNDEGKLYCYLASTFPDRERKFAVDTGIKEIRREGSQNLWAADFKFTDKAKSKKILCLCTDRRIPTTNEGFNSLLKKEAIGKSKKHVNQYGKRKIDVLAVQGILSLGEKSKIFAPLDKSQSDDEQNRFYRPFHLLTNFLEQEGYAGVMYRSTVKKTGYNLALFDISYVKCNEKSIRKVTSI